VSSLNKIVYYLNKIDKLCKKNDMGDIFSYSKVKEVLIAAKLGHTVPKEYAGADGYDKSGDGVEYKSTIGKNINGTYNGISVQSTWNKQLEYLKNEKIGKYPFHYFGKFDGTTIVELYELTAKDVLKVLIPKFKKDYERKTSPNSKHKDPRLGSSINMTEIKKYGKSVL
jgi:hypothetical protein